MKIFMMQHVELSPESWDENWLQIDKIRLAGFYTHEEK